MWYTQCSTLLTLCWWLHNIFKISKNRFQTHKKIHLRYTLQSTLLRFVCQVFLCILYYQWRESNKLCDQPYLVRWKVWAIDFFSWVSACSLLAIYCVRMASLGAEFITATTSNPAQDDAELEVKETLLQELQDPKQGEKYRSKAGDKNNSFYCDHACCNLWVQKF